MAAVDHVAARLETHLAHAQIVGTQRAAQAAQRAAVDHPIGLAVAEHDAEIVVDVAHVALRIRAVVLEVLAGLDAFEAMAGEAAARLGDRLVAAVAALRIGRRDRRNGRVRPDIDVEAGCRRPARRPGSRSATRPAAGGRSTAPRAARRKPSRSANRRAAAAPRRTPWDCWNGAFPGRWRRRRRARARGRRRRSMTDPRRSPRGRRHDLRSARRAWAGLWRRPACCIGWRRPSAASAATSASTAEAGSSAG